MATFLQNDTLVLGHKTLQYHKLKNTSIASLIFMRGVSNHIAAILKILELLPFSLVFCCLILPLQLNNLHSSSYCIFSKLVFTYQNYFLLL